MAAPRIQGMRSEFAWRANAGGCEEPHIHGEENPRSQWRKLALVVARRESVRPNKQDIGGLTQCCSLSQITPSFPRKLESKSPCVGHPKIGFPPARE